MGEEPIVRPPSIDALARSLADTGLPHPLLVDAARTAVSNGDPAQARLLADLTARQLLQPVINASGVLLHTNLGRARWPIDAGDTPTNVEFDLIGGGRGDRQAATSLLLARCTGAEAGLVVNNCAAAVLLVVTALAGGGSVAVSRGELVEIGGGFRIPDVMAQGGARLVEVGTTNKTRRDDYAAAHARHDLELIMAIHRSNFTIEGFTASPTVAELATVGPPLAVDLGSGLLDTACPWLPGGPPTWLSREPAVRQTLDAGADIVLFSGDKLLGGPQCGIIVGRADLISTCARHPLMRALRCGAPTLGSLQHLLLTYLRRDGASIPFWRQATARVEELQARAETIVTVFGGPDAVLAIASTSTESVTGGGTLPDVTIDSWGVRIAGDVSTALRTATPPIIARMDGPNTLLDLRTVEPHEDRALIDALRGIIRP